MIIDIALVIVLVLSIIIGCKGTWQKKLISLGAVVVAVVTAYFTAPLLAGPIGSISVGETTLVDALTDLVTDKSGGAASKISEVVAPVMGGVFNLFVFCVEAVLLVIIFDIVLLCLRKVFKKHFEKGTAWKTFGVPTLVRSLVMTTVVLLPALVAAPVIKEGSNLAHLLGHDNSIVDLVSDGTRESYYIQGVEFVLDAHDYNFLKYEKDGEEKNLYQEAKKVAQLTKTAPFIEAFRSENVIKSLKALSDEDYAAVVEALNANRDLINDIIPEGLFGDNIDVEAIDFEKEADAVRAVISILDYDENNNLVINTENADAKAFAHALVNSDLASEFLEAGKLADMSEEFKNAVKAELAIMNEDKAQLSDEKYATLLSYLNSVTESTDTDTETSVDTTDNTDVTDDTDDNTGSEDNTTDTDNSSTED